MNLPYPFLSSRHGRLIPAAALTASLLWCGRGRRHDDQLPTLSPPQRKK